MSNILVLNMGMKSIRSIIFNHLGERLASYALPIRTTLAGVTVTQEPDEWWEKAKIVIRESVGGLPGTSVDYITVTTSSSCLVCVDEEGGSLYPCIMVSDRRAETESRQLAEMPEFAAVKEQTGLAMSGSLMLPKILWMRKHQSEIFKNTRYFLSPNDFFVQKLTGELVTDDMNAQKYHYDTESKAYPIMLLQAIGIAVERFPTVMPPGTPIGNVQADIGRELGIGGKCRLILSSYDAICSFMGSGVMEEGEVSDVSGTVTVLRALTYKKEKFHSNLISCMPYYGRDMQIIGGSNNLGGGLIEWVKQCYYQKEEYPYEIMEKEAGEVEHGAGGLIFLPYLLGERVPLWNDEARGVFFGLERMHTRREMTRAVFESTGFIDLGMIEAVEQLGVTISNIRLSGGLARVNLISQLKADIMGREVSVLSEFETTSTGAAMIALVGVGEFSDWMAAVKAFVNIRMIIKPDWQSHKLYREMYILFKEAYEVMKPLFSKRVQLVEKLYGNRRVRIENL